MKRNLTTALAVGLLAVGVLACGGSDDGEEDAQASFDDAQVEFAQCMRDNGIDFPDPEPGGGPGGVALEGVDTESAEFQAATEQCQSIIEEAVPEGDRPDMAEIQDQLLEITQCVRDEGFQVEDPQVGGGGGFQAPPDDLQALMDDPDFQAALEVCQEETGAELGPPGGGQ